jgi:hypothetical protein
MSRKKMSPKQEHEFYKDPKNLTPQAKAVRRRTALTQTVPVRVSPEMLDEVRRVAEGEYRSVGSFIRLAVANELERRRPARRRSTAHG